MESTDGGLKQVPIMEILDKMARQSNDTLERIAILSQRLSGVLMPEVNLPDAPKKSAAREQKSPINMLIEDEIQRVIAIGGIIESILVRLEI